MRVGVSGWTYPPWRGDFYPKGLPQRDELAYAASRLTSIEINGSFYALQKPESYRKWRDQTPDDFVFAVKGSRFISHMKRLADAEEPLKRFFDSGVFELAPKLGPVLWQLPETFEYDEERLATFFEQLPRKDPEGRPVRHALEFRSKTFEHSRPTGCCASTGSPASWPTPPAAGPRSRRTPPTSAISGFTATPSSTPVATTTRRSTAGRRSSEVAEGRLRLLRQRREGARAARRRAADPAADGRGGRAANTVMAAGTIRQATASMASRVPNRSPSQPRRGGPLRKAP